MKPTFSATPAASRRWFEKNAAKQTELLVGFHKRGSGTPSITWPESVDQALGHLLPRAAHGGGARARSGEAVQGQNAPAWRFFSAQPPWYRRTAAPWVISAKKEETRERRLATLIADSAAGRTIRQLTTP